MFRPKNEVKSGTYTEDDHESITLAAGGKTVKCAGAGTIEIGSVDLPNSLNVRQLHGTFISVGYVRDQ